MIRALRIHLWGIRLSLAGRMAYRGDFFFSLLMMLVSDLILPLATFLIYRSGASFPGWSLAEAMLIQGVFMISRGIAFPLFFGSVWHTLSSIRDGTFDMLLLRPHSPLHMSMVMSFGSEDLGILIGGLLLTGVSLAALPAPSLAGWLEFGLLLLVSLLVLLSFAILMSATVFKWVGNSRVYEIFESVTTFGQYPVSIFSKAFAGLITWILPISMIGYLPASVLLGKPDKGILAAVPSAFLLLGFSVLLWEWMQHKYTSAGG